MLESAHSLEPGDAISRKARLFFLHDQDLEAVTGVVTRADGHRFTLRARGAARLEVGRTCVLALRTEAAMYRGRVRIVAAGDIALEVELLEPIRRSDRRMYPRADVVLRFLAWRVESDSPAWPHRGVMSLAPDEGTWLTEEVELSPSGMRGPVPGRWSEGDRLELRLHVPGPRGGDHVQVRAQIVQVFDEDPFEVAVRFVDLDADTQLHLVEIVDRARLDDFFE